MDFTTAMIIVFVIGYIAIAFEHPIKINKTASALITAAVCWSIYALFSSDIHKVEHDLSHHLAEASQILFFLMGAMTIVELVDAHQGFRIITDNITTKNKVKLLWLISWLSFFMSAVLDNLTTAIVMVSLLRKIIKDDEQRKYFAGIVIIAANAGGAWSPIGDVTTTMLWIEDRITALDIIVSVFIPSVICLLVPLFYVSIFMKGDLEGEFEKEPMENRRNSLIMLLFGIACLIFVPIFKTITHLPPYLGILFGLGIIWVVSEILNNDKDEQESHSLTAQHALSRIDTSSVLFFLGILIAIGSLQSIGALKALAMQMDKTIGNQNIIVLAIGLASAVIDNVPLVAATMGMYDIATYPTGHRLWEFLAYCAGTGGSALIIGSAAGVAVMGMEKIDFLWYLRKISLLAILGYFAGAVFYMLFS